jgi:DNA-binding response OmpR family regulator
MSRRGSRTKRSHEAETEVKEDLMMASQQNGERTRVMIVEQDLDFGLKLADWLATHGYQTVFVRTVDAAIDGLSGFQPQVVFIGLGWSAPAAQTDMVEVLLLIQTISPCTPVIMMADESSEDLTQVLLRQGVRRFLIKPVKLSEVSALLQSELSAAMV